MKKVLFTLSILIIAAGYLAAQQNVSRDEKKSRAESVSKNISNDQIFNDIMQSLSPDMRMKLDSTKHALKSQDSLKRKSINEIHGTSKQLPECKNIAASIPEELKDKVDKTIKEIELNHQQRAIEFKEKMNKKK